MGARFSGVTVGGQLNLLPANATETLILTTGPVITTFDSQPLIIEVFFNIVVGTGTTALIVTIRRGPLVTSPIVSGVLTHTVVAGNSVNVKTSQLDNPGPQGPVQYSYTIAQTGATAGGTLPASSMWVLAF